MPTLEDFLDDFATEIQKLTIMEADFIADSFYDGMRKSIDEGEVAQGLASALLFMAFQEKTNSYKNAKLQESIDDIRWYLKTTCIVGGIYLVYRWYTSPSRNVNPNNNQNGDQN
mmetsp:Transcript_29264/g.35852  ORF Transcript_29264/g.35852 Transcript_29264/m.35852 type:complete len:114 (-) Transcript_29264:57-398(-)